MSAVKIDLDDGEELVGSMTRPMMLGPLTLVSIGLSAYVPGMVALLLRSLWPTCLIPVLLVASYLICLKDVYLFNIAFSCTRLKVCRNKNLYGCRRYAAR